MEWLKSLFVEHSALQAVVVISLISTIGIALGRIRIFGISLHTSEAAVLRRRIHPQQKKEGGSQT